MRGALDSLMLRGPSWLIRRHVDEHPSRGLDVVLRVLQKRLPTVYWTDKLICKDVVYTKVSLTAREESYGSLSVTMREYIIVALKSNIGEGFLEIAEYGSMKCLIYIAKNFTWFSENLGIQQMQLGKEMFKIIQDHREYPIWTTKCAVITFLLCARSLPFPPEVYEMIAKEVWASRHDRKIWWPDITDDDWNRDK